MEDVLVTFENRCLNDPAGVIKDLIGQTTRQCGEIARLMLLTEGVLLPVEASHLINVLAKQPPTVSRDFIVEDLEEKIVKKLKAIEAAEKKKEKKGKGKK